MFSTCFTNLGKLFVIIIHRHARFHVIENKLISYRTIIPICLILSFFFHPGSKNEYYFSFQMFVSMSMFIEACALMP